MSVWRLFRHYILSQRRSVDDNRRLLSLLIRGFVFLYAALVLAVVGLSFDEIARKITSTSRPLILASHALIPFGLMYGAVQVGVRSGLRIDPRPYENLPIRKRTLITLLASLEIFSWWNALPLVFFCAVSAGVAWTGPVAEAARFGVASAGVLVTITYAVPVARRALAGRFGLAVLVIVAAVGIGATEVAGTLGRFIALSDVSGWMLGGVVQGHVAPSLVAAGIAGVSILGYVAWLNRVVFSEEERRVSSSRQSVGVFVARGFRRRPVVREALLEALLVLRNSQPRTLMAWSLVVPGVFCIAGLTADAPAQLSGLYTPTLTFVGPITSGVFALGYCANLFSWEGSYFDATMAWPVTGQHRMEGKLLFLGGVTTTWFLVPVPFLWPTSFLMGHPPNTLFVLLAFYLYNLGVTLPMLVAGASFNRTSAPLHDQTGAQLDVSGFRSLFFLFVFAIPVLIVFFVQDPLTGLSVIAGLGVSSLAAFPVWRRGLRRLYHRNRHSMAQGFRSSRS